jgi:micrococcal nuclease
LVPLNSQVNLNIIELDQYGRVLAEVLTLNGINTGKKMLTEGLLVRYPYQKNCQAYDSFQTEAKNKKIGVWSDPNFVLPYEYRRTTINPLIG